MFPGYFRWIALVGRAFKRAEGWWGSADHASLYRTNYEAAGFYQVDQPQSDDMIMMDVGRTAYLNSDHIRRSLAPPYTPGPQA